MSALDLTGHVFGKLTVVHRAENIGKAVAWKCACSCGGEATIRTMVLRRGDARSCGCIRALDLTGSRVGRLTVVRRVANRGRRTYWECLCDCGTKHEVITDALSSGKTRSCGCLARETASARMTTHGHTQGYKPSRTYCSWESMITRCTKSGNVSYKNYGGRGIIVCARWMSFERFLEDMGERPVGTTLDRIDVDGNYEPTNCRWATRLEQAANRRPVFSVAGLRRALAQGDTEVLRVIHDFLAA